MSAALSMSRSYLSKKFQIRFSTDLYKYLIKSQYLFTPEKLKELNQMELLYHIIFLGTHPERRNQGEQAKITTLKCLQQYRGNQQELTYDFNSQLLLALSNVLLYDGKLIQNILKQVDKQKYDLSIHDMIKFQHCLYKLNIHNEPLNDYFFKKTMEIYDQLDYHEYVQYMHIRSNLYRLGSFDQNNLAQLARGLENKIKTNKNQQFTSKFNFQYCQMMYNLYPEIINQDKPQVNKQNPFSNEFNVFLRDYNISKKLVDLKLQDQSLDYIENQGMQNLLKVKEDQAPKQLTQLEQLVQRLLKKLNKVNERRKRVLVYDIDYMVENKFIINCNDSVHFLEDFNLKVLSINPNHLMELRHLSNIGYKIIDLNYYDWIQLKEEQALQKLQDLLQ